MLYAHRLTWDELVAAATKKNAITSYDGYLVCSRDRKFNVADAYNMHINSIGLALEKDPEDVPLAVETAYKLRQLENKRFQWGTNYPAATMVNVKNKPFSWSHTALSQFQTCPFQYAAARYYITTKFEETDATRWGGRVHKALEMRLKRGTPLPQEMKKWEKYCTAFEKNAEKLNATIHPEYQLAISKNFSQTDWFDKTAWGRCAGDVVIDAGNTIYVYDYKTGKMREGSEQLATNAAFFALAFPEAQKFVTRYVWLEHDQITGKDFSREEIPGIWDDRLSQIVNIMECWEQEDFPCRRSGLCNGWCQVTDCEHWRPKR